MRKYCVLIFLLIIGLSNVYAQNFNQDPGNPNLDFSMGNFSNWTLSWGTLTNPELTSGMGGPSTHIIVENYGNNWDGNAGIGNLPRVPSGLSRVGRLGHPAGNGYGSPAGYKMKYPISVNAQFPILFFQLAAVLDNNHSNANNTHYKFAIKNAQGQIIPSQPCTGLQLYPQGSGTTMSGSNPQIIYPLSANPSGTYQYHRWESVAMDLSTYAGQTIWLEFEHYDCVMGYHGSYTYLSAAMRQQTDTIYYCKGSSSVILKPYLPRFKNYLWDNGSTADSIIVTNPINGSQSSCMVQSYNGCSATFHYVMKEVDMEANFDYYTGGCNEIIFSDNSQSDIFAITNWAWYFETFNNPANQTAQNPSYTYSDTGYYNVTLVAGNSLGCKDTVALPVYVSPSNSYGDFTFEQACVDSPVQFTDLSSGSITNHNWNFGDGNQSSDNNPTNTYTSSGTYNVSLVIENLSGCKDTIIKQITVNPLPNANFFVDSIFCENEIVLFNNTSNGAFSYLWDFGDSIHSTLENPSHQYLAPGFYTITLTTISAAGCISSTQNTIQLYQNPIAAFDHQFTSDTQINFNNQSQHETSWQWQFGDGQESNLENPTHNYNSEGNYTIILIVTSHGSCMDTTSITIEIQEEIIIPNIFTPNGDANNDLFSIDVGNNISIEIKIYNRWGNIVFETNEPNKAWDGKTNGTYASDGVYFYVIYTKSSLGTQKEYKGTVTLAR